MEKTLKELKLVMEARAKQPMTKKNRRKILGIGLSARRNLCVHRIAGSYQDRTRVDAECRKLTAEWIRDSDAPVQSEIC